MMIALHIISWVLSAYMWYCVADYWHAKGIAHALDMIANPYISLEELEFYDKYYNKHYLNIFLLINAINPIKKSVKRNSRRLLFYAQKFTEDPVKYEGKSTRYIHSDLHIEFHKAEKLKK